MGEPQALKRPRFFSGRLLTPADLELEQQYVREKLKRHNRTLHGFGIVSGLKVKMNAGEIVVEPGLALDCEGNELLIETPQSVAPPPVVSSSGGSSADGSPSDRSSLGSSDASSSVEWHTAYLNVRFVEDCATTPCAQSTPVVPATDVENASNTSVDLTESFELAVVRENCNRGHRHLRARWLACGQAHALTIARLRRRSQGWSVDRGYRPPFIK